MARPYTIQAEFQADFRSIEAQAKKFGNRFGKIVEEAMDLGAHPKVTASLEKYLKDMKRRQERLANHIADYEYAARVKSAGNVSEVEKELAAKIVEYRSKLVDQSLSESKRQEIKNNLEVEERRQRALRKSDADHQKQIKGLRDLMRATQRAADKAGKSARSTIERIDRGQKIIEENAERLHKVLNASATDFVSTIEDGLGGLSDTLRGSIDLGSLIKSGTSKMGSFLGGGADMLSGMAAGATGAAAAITGAAAAVVALVAAIVAVAGVIAAVMVSVDKEIKEFNKSAINTFGARSALSYGLDNFRHAVQDLTLNLGLTEQEAVGLFDTLDQGGYSLQRITKGIEDVEERNRALNVTLQRIVATSKSLGVTVNEFTAQATEMSNDYATSLEDIVGQFASIGKMAQEAGFSTRRFYSLVVQATSSQASLNVRVSETAEILSRMSKILGDKQAASFLEGMGGSFKTASSTDLMKTALVAGVGNVREIAREELESQSRVFLGEVKRGGNLSALESEAAKVGITSIDVNNPEEFAASLAKLSTDDRNKLISSVTEMDSGLGRRLDDLTRLSENAEGGLTEIPEAMRTFSTGGIVKTYAKMAENFGFSLDDMNAIQRTAFANISGLSEEQISQMQALARNGEGTFSRLKELAAATGDQTEAQKQAMLKEKGVYVENGKIFDSVGNEITNAFDYLTTAQATGHLDDKKVMSEEMSLAYKAFAETVTIGDMIENKIVYYLRSMYDVIGGPLMRTLGQILGFGNEAERAMASDLRSQLTTEIEGAMTRIADSRSGIAELEAKESAGEKLDDQEKARLKSVRDSIAADEAVIERSRDLSSRLDRGDYSALRGARSMGEGDMEVVDLSRRRDASAVMEEVRTGGSVFDNPAAVGESTATEDRVRNVAAFAAMAPLTVMGPSGLALLNLMSGLTGSPETSAPLPVVPPATVPSTPTESVVKDTSDTGTKAVVDATNEIVGAMEESSDYSVSVLREEGSDNRTTIENEHEDTRKHLTKILTRETKLGDALARSRLPDALVEAEVRQKIMTLAHLAGVTDPKAVSAAVDEYFEKGTISSLATGLAANIATSPEIGMFGGELGFTSQNIRAGTPGRGRLPSNDDSSRDTVADEVDDFIYRGDGVRGTITPIDERDTFVGMKPGGPIDRALGGGGGSVTVNIYGGDERRVYDVVKRVLQQTGIGPTRVSSRA